MYGYPLPGSPPIEAMYGEGISDYRIWALGNTHNEPDMEALENYPVIESEGWDWESGIRRAFQYGTTSLRQGEMLLVIEGDTGEKRRYTILDDDPLKPVFVVDPAAEVYLALIGDELLEEAAAAASPHPNLRLPFADDGEDEEEFLMYGGF